MTTNTYDKGDSVRLTATFTVDSVPTDPTTVTLKVKNPAGVTTTYTYGLAELTKSSTGVYYREVTVDDDGMYYYRFEGTGTCIAASEGQLKVRSSEF